MEPADHIVVAPARPVDEPAIRALLQQAGLPHEDFSRHLENFSIARAEGELLGVVGFELEGTDALLRSLAVAPACRGRGLGDRLLARAVVAAGTRGGRRLYLLTTTAELFFARRGFRVVSRELVPPAVAATREFRDLCPASAVCMTRAVEA
jgi:amino-acid N-acetyltransferase